MLVCSHTFTLAHVRRQATTFFNTADCNADICSRGLNSILFKKRSLNKKMEYSIEVPVNVNCRRKKECVVSSILLKSTFYYFVNLLPFVTTTFSTENTK